MSMYMLLHYVSSCGGRRAAALPDPEVVLLTEVITHAFSRTSWTSEYLDVVVQFGGCTFGWLPSVVNFKKAWSPNDQKYEFLSLFEIVFLMDLYSYVTK